MSKPSYPITDAHFLAFGKIIHITAELDGLMDQIIMGMTHGQPMLLPILGMLRTKDKTDYIEAMAKLATWQPIVRDGLEKLIKRVKGTHALRNQIAHCGWIAGRKAGSIKPVAMYSRGMLKLLGIEHNEKEWTAEALKDEVARYEEIGNDLATFMKRYGLFPAIT